MHGLGCPYLAENSSKDSSCPWEPVSALASAASLERAREEEEKAATERRAGTAAWRRNARGAAVLRAKARGSARMKEVEAIVCGGGVDGEVAVCYFVARAVSDDACTMIFGSGVAGWRWQLIGGQPGICQQRLMGEMSCT